MIAVKRVLNPLYNFLFCKAGFKPALLFFFKAIGFINYNKTDKGRAMTCPVFL